MASPFFFNQTPDKISSEPIFIPPSVRICLICHFDRYFPLREILPPFANFNALPLSRIPKIPLTSSIVGFAMPFSPQNSTIAFANFVREFNETSLLFAPFGRAGRPRLAGVIAGTSAGAWALGLRPRFAGVLAGASAGVCAFGFRPRLIFGFSSTGAWAFGFRPIFAGALAGFSAFGFGIRLAGAGAGDAPSNSAIWASTFGSAILDAF